MTPGRIRRVVAVEVLVRDPPVVQEVVVLLGAWNGRENVEGRVIRPDTDENVEMLFKRFASVTGKAEDVGEMCNDPSFAAETDDLAIEFRVILRLVRRKQRLPAE